MTRGATPAAAAATTRALGVNLCRFNAPSEARSNAQAPSFTPEAFPAVIVPFGFTTGFSLEVLPTWCPAEDVHLGKRATGHRSFAESARQQFPASICSCGWPRPRAAGS